MIVNAVEPLKWVGNVVTHSTTTTTVTGSANLQYYNYYGSNFNGINGAVNRTINQSGAGMVTVDNFYLHPNIDYVIEGNFVKILKPLFNTQIVTIYVDTTLVSNNYLGIELSGANGQTGRTLNTNNAQIVVVDNFILHPLLQYTNNGTLINFSINIFNNQVISVWS